MAKGPCPIGVKGVVTFRRLTIIKDVPVEIPEKVEGHNVEMKINSFDVDIDFGNKELDSFDKFEVAIKPKLNAVFSKELGKGYCIKGSIHFLVFLEIERYVEGEDNIKEKTEIDRTVVFSGCKKGKKLAFCCQKKFSHVSEKDEEPIEINQKKWKGKLTVKKGSTKDIIVECWQKKTRYLGNNNIGHMEIHDLKNTKDGCKIEDIKPEHIEYFDSVKEGLDKEFNGCFFCLRKYHTE